MGENRIKCEYCGFQNPDNVSQCLYCGKEIVIQPEQKNKKGNPLLFIIIGVVVVVVLGVIGYFLLNR